MKSVSTTPVEKAHKKDTFAKYFPKDDFVLLFGELGFGLYTQWLSMFRDHFRRRSSHNDNVSVLIATPGGSADDAFRMMRLLQNNYKNITVIILGCCYSAGTLFCK